jgi:O-antigen/teichoic acid export membrane protein
VSEPREVPGESVARNTTFAFLAQVATTVFTAGLTLYLVRALGPDAFGVFSLAMAIGLLLVEPFDFGISDSSDRFIADHRHDRAAVADVFSDALRLKLLTGLTVGVLLFALAGPIAVAFGHDELAWPLRGMAVAAVAQGLQGFVAGAFISLNRNSLYLGSVFSESLFEATASIALVALGGGAAGAAFGRAIGYLAGAAIALVLIYRLLGRRAIVPWGRSRGHVRRIARYARTMWVINTSWMAFGQVNALLVGAFLGAVHVGFFQAANRLTTILVYPGLALANGVAPRMSRGGAGPQVDTFQASIRYLLVLQVALAVPIVVWADPLTTLALGDEYGESVAVLRALGPYVLISGLAPLLSIAVNYLGDAPRRVPIAIGALAINVGVSLALVPTIGIVGAAIAIDVGFLAYTGGHFWICNRIVGLRLRPLALTLLRSLAAGIAMAGVLVALGTSDIGIGVLIGGGLAALIVYAGAILALGEFSRAERAAARAFLARSLRRAPRPTEPV